MPFAIDTCIQLTTCKHHCISLLPFYSLLKFKICFMYELSMQEFKKLSDTSNKKMCLRDYSSYSCNIKYGTLASRASLILVHSCTLTKVNVTPGDAFAGTEERCRYSSNPFMTLGKTQYPLYGRMGGPRGPVWTGTENLAPSRIQSPECPAFSKTLYQLHYPNHILYTDTD